MVTLKDVAEMAGVSASTVSYVLNGKKTVRPETLQRIEDAIEKLDYCPNLLASSLKTNQSKSIGVVVSDLRNRFFIDMLTSIEDELSKKGYCMMVCNADNSADKEKKSLRRLLSRNIDGLILIGTGENEFSNYRKLKLPLVCIDRVSDETFLTIKTDNVMGGKIGTQYLLQKGYKRIVFLGDQGNRFSKERYEGYCHAMQEAKMEAHIHAERLNQFTQEEALAVIDRIMQKDKEFDAIFGANDYIALYVLNALTRRGIDVPAQVGVLGFDNIVPAEYTTPALSSVAQQKCEIGITAVQYLLRMLQGEKLKEKQVLFEPYIVERETCR